MNAVKRYQQTQQTTASPGRLLVLLLHAAIKNMRIAAEELDAKKPLEARTVINKANDIVMYLQSTLDHAVAPEMCENLDSVYGFVSLRLSAALLSNDSGKVREAERVLLPVVEAFETAVTQAQDQP